MVSKYYESLGFGNVAVNCIGPDHGKLVNFAKNVSAGITELFPVMCHRVTSSVPQVAEKPINLNMFQALVVTFPYTSSGQALAWFIN